LTASGCAFGLHGVIRIGYCMASFLYLMTTVKKQPQGTVSQLPGGSNILKNKKK
jgi:hypothetical protein